MRWRLSIIVLCCLAIAIVAGCSSPAQQKPLRIGICLWPGYEPFFLARDLGFYDNLPITIIEYPSPSGAARAMKSGTIDAVALTLDEVLLLIDSDVDARVVLVTDISNGGDVILARPPIESVAQLAGQRVASEATVLASYMLSRALTQHALTPDEVERIYRPMSEHLQLYQDGEVDALVTFEPAKTHLLNMGAQQIFSSADIPGEIVDVLAVSNRYTNKRPEVVRGLIDGWYRALDFFNQQPDTAAEMISTRLQITPQEVKESYHGLELPSRDEVAGMLGGESMGILPAAERLQQTMYGHGLLNDKSNLKMVFTDQLLQ